MQCFAAGNRGVYTMQALEQMLHEKSWGEAFLAYFYPKLGGKFISISCFQLVNGFAM